MSKKTTGVGHMLRRVLFATFLLFSIACGEGQNSPTLEAGVQYEPNYVPLVIRFNSRGEISLRASGARLPTPIGTFSVYANVSFPDRKTLTIVAGNAKHVYDLHDRPFRVYLPNDRLGQSRIEYDGAGNIVVVIPEPDIPTYHADESERWSAPSPRFTPDGKEIMSWRITDECTDRKGIILRFYSSDRTLVWPNAKQDYFLPRGGTRIFRIAVEPRAYVCYGAKPDRATGDFWGVGIHGKDGCKACCYRSNGSEIPIRLTC